MDLLNMLKWRYATKAMNGQIVEDEKIDRILTAIQFAPSSNGLHPYEIIVIKSAELKAKISSVAYNQPVITACSHLVIFAAWDNVTEKRVNQAFDYIIAERGIYPGLEDYRNSLLNTHTGQSSEQNFNHAARQAYIGLGFGVIAATNEQVDSTPMEGFNPAALDDLLKLNEIGLKSVSMLALGYRDTENDWLVKLTKVRKPKKDFIHEMG